MKIARYDGLRTPLIRFALKIAMRAGNIATLRYKKEHNIRYKADGTPVSDVDMKIERSLRNAISQRFPRHAIVGEEYPNTKGKGDDYCWYIDPIDGTEAFINGGRFRLSRACA